MLYSYFILFSILEKRHGTLRRKKKKKYWGERRGREGESARVCEREGNAAMEAKGRREKENEGGRKKERESADKKKDLHVS